MKSHLIAYILEVALYAERPTLRRGTGQIRSLVGAISSGAPSETIKMGIEGALSGIEKSIHLRLYGKAYLQDAKDDLARFTGENVQPAESDWKRRDAMINDACNAIARIANLESFVCIPE